MLNSAATNICFLLLFFISDAATLWIYPYPTEMTQFYLSTLIPIPLVLFYIYSTKQDSGIPMHILMLKKEKEKKKAPNSKSTKQIYTEKMHKEQHQDIRQQQTMKQLRAAANLTCYLALLP